MQAKEKSSGFDSIGFYPTRGESQLKETLEKRPRVILTWLGYKGKHESIEGHDFGYFKRTTIRVIAYWCDKENRIKTKGFPRDTIVQNIKIGK